MTMTEIYDFIFGGDTPSKEIAERKVMKFLEDESLTITEVIEEIEESSSVMYFGAVMDGQFD